MAVEPVPIDPPLTGMMELHLMPAGVRLLEPDSAAEVAEVIRREGVQWVWVEGFSFSGKSSLAAKLAHILEWRWIELDALVAEGNSGEQYADLMDRARLVELLGTPELRRNVVVEGVCLRDVMALLGPVESALVVYLARVSGSAPGSYLWHNGLTMEQPSDDEGWLWEETIRYHGATHPYLDARFIFLRVSDTAPIA